MTEQKEVDTAVAHDDAECASPTKIGKFNTPEDLLAAYNALESEFTKRCQLVKKLQSELGETRAQAQSQVEQNGGNIAPAGDGETESATGADSADIASVAVRGQAKDSHSANAVASDVLEAVVRNAADYAERLCALPEIMDACVSKYKQRLLENRVGVSPSGMAVIVPQKRPRSLAEAKRLADEMLGAD